MGDPESTSFGTTCMGLLESPVNRPPLVALASQPLPTSIDDVVGEVMDSSLVRAHFHNDPRVIEGSYIKRRSSRSLRNLHLWVSETTNTEGTGV